MEIQSILYVGEQTGNSLSRLNALRRLGFTVDVITPRLLLPQSVWVDRIFWKFSALPFEHFVNDGLKKALKSKDRYDLVWVNAGDYLMPSSVNILKTKADKIINYNTDDPFGGRDKLRHYGYLKALMKVGKKLFSSIFKIIYFTFLLNSKKRKIYFQRFSGLLNSMIGKKSWYRPKIINN